MVTRKKMLASREHHGYCLYHHLTTVPHFTFGCAKGDILHSRIVVNYEWPGILFWFIFLSSEFGPAL